MPDPRPLDTASLFREHAPFVWRVLRRLGIAEADTADVCQEVFVIVHRRLAEFEHRSSARTWIYGISVRAAADHRKRVRRRREEAIEVSPEAILAASQDDMVSLREARALLDRALDQLDDDKRTVFVLYELEELGMAEIATVVGCPLQTAYSRLHAARSIVQRAIRAMHTTSNESPSVGGNKVSP